MNNSTAIAAALLVGIAGSAQAAGDPVAGQARSAICAGCHGPDGNSFNPLWPKLAGQQVNYLVKQMQDFKSGVRKDPVMSGMAAPLTDADMLNLAVYYATQKTQPATAADDLVAKGRMLYKGGNLATGVVACAGCHGPDGKGNGPARFPGLVGQHAAYTEKQLADFRNGHKDEKTGRANDLNGMMRGVAAKMSEDEIKAVAAYIASLK